MIKYIGVDDNDIKLFENQYVVPAGMSYNSYLILDEKVAIMDTVDARKGDEWLAKLTEALGDRTPDYLVVHHLEPDHSGLIAEVVSRWPNIQLVASQRALQMLPQFCPQLINYQLNDRALGVREGDTLSLGEHTLHFIDTPMVHWPEVIMSFDDATGTLFSADGFGKFGALTTDDDWACEARRYYFNICGKYGAQVQRALQKVQKFDVKAIYPLHGPMLTEHLEYYIGLYDTWSRYEVETPGILIAHASIYGHTQQAAERLADLLRERTDQRVVVADLVNEDMAEIIEDAFRMSHLVLASATYDGELFPVMSTFLHHLKMKNFQKRSVALVENGSWAPVAAKAMRNVVETMHDIEFVEPVVTLRTQMTAETEAQLVELAENLLK